MKRKSGFILVTILICGLLFSLFPINVKAEIDEIYRPGNYEWEFGYTGGVQEFTAPYAGSYNFGLFGAQGAKCSNGKEGGNGGFIEVNLVLKKGDRVSVYVGGQDGYNGGGTGKVSNGGGATDIRINGERIAIAGGGGGGTETKAGGIGGGTDSGNNNTLYTGSSDTNADGSAGGGGGYYGGTAGYIEKHTHSGGCYTTCTGTLIWGNANNDGLAVGSCNSCGRQVTASGQNPGAHPDDHNGNKCGISIKTCTKTSVTTASYGGSSWYNAGACKLISQFPGYRAGDGRCGVNLVEKYTLLYGNTPCLKLYYNNVEVKKLYYDNVLVLDNSSKITESPVW